MRRFEGFVRRILRHFSTPSIWTFESYTIDFDDVWMFASVHNNHNNHNNPRSKHTLVFSVRGALPLLSPVWYFHVVASSWRTRQCRSKAGRGGERSEQNHTATIWDPLTPPPELFELSFDEEPSGARPDRLVGVRPHRGADSAAHSGADWRRLSLMHTLGVPESQVVDHLVAVLKGPDTAVPEQIVAVVSSRLDVVAFLLRQPVEQTVDIPAPGACGFAGYGSLQGFLSEHQNRVLLRLRLLSSVTLTFQCLVVVRLDKEVFKVFSPGQSSTAPFVEQIVDIPVPGGGLQDFLPNQGSAASSSVPADEPFQWVSQTLPSGKKCALWRQVSAELGGHVSSSTLAAQLDDFWVDEACGMWMWLPLAGGSCSAQMRTSIGTSPYGVRLLLHVTRRQEWLWRVLCSFWFTLFAQWHAEQLLVLAEPGPLSRACLGGLQMNFTFCTAMLFALFALGNLVHYFLYILVSGSGCCWSTGYGYVGRCRYVVDTRSVSALGGVWTNGPHFLRRGGLGS